MGAQQDVAATVGPWDHDRHVPSDRAMYGSPYICCNMGSSVVEMKAHGACQTGIATGRTISGWLVGRWMEP